MASLSSQAVMALTDAGCEIANIEVILSHRIATDACVEIEKSVAIFLSEIQDLIDEEAKLRYKNSLVDAVNDIISQVCKKILKYHGFCSQKLPVNVGIKLSDLASPLSELNPIRVNKNFAMILTKVTAVMRANPTLPVDWSSIPLGCAYSYAKELSDFIREVNGDPVEVGYFLKRLNRKFNFGFTKRTEELANRRLLKRLKSLIP